MEATISVPVKTVQSVAEWRLPPRADRRLQRLMDRHNEGQLTAEERDELESLVEFSETISLVRASALRLLGRRRF